MTLIKKTTASAALVALTSGLFVNGASADSASEIQAAEKLAAAGIVVKQSNTADYQLGRQVLRQEIAAVARGIAKVEKTSTCTNLFKDVSATKPNTWACYTVEALANAGLIAKNANFRPEANITKAEAVGMIVKARYGNEYNPVSGAGEWQKQVVDFAVSKGIASQFTNYNTPATRGFVFEVAAKTLPEDSDKLLCELFGTCKDDKPEKPTVDSDKAIQRNDSNLNVSLSAQSPSNGMVAANSPRAVLLAFDVTAGKEDVTLKKALLKFTGTGNEGSIQDLSVYVDDVKVTRNSGTFNSRLESNLSFDKDTVIKAGETKTLFVTGNIVPVAKQGETVTYNQMLRVSLDNLEASATVTGAKLTGATLTPYLVSNKAELEADSSVAKGNLYIGKEDLIYVFNLKEKNKREDVTVKTLTFEKTDGSDKTDLDNLSNLSLTVNGKKVDATFTYKKNKIVVNLNETVKAGQRVTFALRGEMIDGLTDKLWLQLNTSGIYVIGNTTWVSSNVTWKLEAIEKSIVGSSINFSFNREGSNEVSENSDDVKVGDLVFVTKTDYNADIRILVDKDKESLFDGLELDSTIVSKDFVKKSTKPGIKYDIVKEAEKSTAEKISYLFKDVSLPKGTTKLPLTIDVKENVLWTESSKDINFKVEFDNLRDEALDKDVDTSVLNNKTLSKTVNIVKSGLTVVNKKVTDTRTTTKGNPEVVLYKGSINVNGSEDITIDNMTLNVDSSNKTVSLNNKLSGVTLNIGGKTFSGNVSGDEILFNSVFATIQKGAKNVEFLVTSVLSERDVTAEETLEVISLWMDLSAVKSNPSFETLTKVKNKNNTLSTVVSLTEKTNLEVISNKTIEKTIVAGTQNAEIGSFRLKSTSSKIYVKNLELTSVITPDSATDVNSISNIRLMNGSETLQVAELETGKIVFKNFELPALSSDTTLTVVADLPAIADEGGAEKTFIWTIKINNVTLTSDDALIQDKDTGSKMVTIVPAKVTVASTDRLWDKDEFAAVKVTVSKDNSSKLNPIKLKSLEFSKDISTDKVATIIVNGKTINVAEKAEIGKVKKDDSESKLLTLKDDHLVDVTDLNEFNIQIILKTGESLSNLYLNKVNFESKFNFSNSSDNEVYLGSYTAPKQ